jgi:hypothetical protein
MKSGMLQAEPIVVQAHVVNAVNVDGGFNPSAPPPPPFSNPSLPRFENEGGAREFLMQHHFPLGLQDAFIHTMTNLPLRFFIIDDSGSMSMNDGNRLVEGGAKSK